MRVFNLIPYFLLSAMLTFAGPTQPTTLKQQITDPSAEDIVWRQGGSYSYTVITQKGRPTIAIPSGALPVLKVWDNNNLSQNYLTITGEVVNADSGQCLVTAPSQQTTLPPGDSYSLEIALSDGTNYQPIVIAALTVEYSQAASNLPQVTNKTLFVTKFIDLSDWSGNTNTPGHYLAIAADGSITNIPPPVGAGGGSGDVVGPSSAVDDRIATFDTTTGKLIQDSGVSVADLATASALTAETTARTAADTAFTASLTSKANSNATVNLTGDQVIAGRKIYSGSVVASNNSVLVELVVDGADAKIKATGSGVVILEGADLIQGSEGGQSIGSALNPWSAVYGPPFGNAAGLTSIPAAELTGTVLEPQIASTIARDSELHNAATNRTPTALATTGTIALPMDSYDEATIIQTGAITLSTPTVLDINKISNLSLNILASSHGVTLPGGVEYPQGTPTFTDGKQTLLLFKAWRGLIRCVWDEED